jgi:hypothetical protein
LEIRQRRAGIPRRGKSRDPNNTIAAIAAEYGIAKGVVSQIVYRRKWAWLKEGL